MTAGSTMGRRAALVLVAVLALLVGALPVAGASHAQGTSDPDDDAPGSGKSLTIVQPLLGWRVAVDPGHNGGNATDAAGALRQVADGRGGTKVCNSLGTRTTSGYPEHEFTLDVATALAAELERLGAEVEMTRTDDDSVGPCVDVRGRFAEDVDADLMLSLHANGSVDPEQQGYFAIVAEPAVSPSQDGPSRDLAQDVLVALADAGFEPSTAVEGALSERNDLATLNFARRPAVMLELGEMRNAEDAALMESEEGRQKYADALTAGVLAWTEDREPRG